MQQAHHRLQFRTRGRAVPKLTVADAVRLVRDWNAWCADGLLLRSIPRLLGSGIAR